MDFLPGRRQRAAALLLAISGLCSAEVPVARTGIFSVVAFATDVHAVVISVQDGQLHRYMRGDALPGSDWRVLEVAAAGVTLQRDTRLYGQPLRMTLQPGEHIDLDVLNRMHTDLQTPVMAPDRESVHTLRKTQSDD